MRKNTYQISGFTLIELMIVVAIIAVLAAIAYPSYKSYVLKARRSDAKSALMNTAQRMERFYTEKMTLNAASLGTGSTDIAETSSPDRYYTIAFDSAPTSATICGGTATSNGTATAYRICATPAGSQAADTCGIFSIDHQGVRLPATTGCWK
jgi:type IV pilus assembly protein PilE